jgi:hypothetical protein
MADRGVGIDPTAIDRCRACFQAPVLKFGGGRPFLCRLVSKRDLLQSLKGCRGPLLFRLVPARMGAFGSKIGSKANLRFPARSARARAAFQSRVISI